MNDLQESIKLIGSIVGIVLSILGFVWTVIKEWDKVPPSLTDYLKRFLGPIFRPGIAWILLFIISGFTAYSIWVELTNTTFPIEKASVTSIFYEGGEGYGYLTTTSSIADGNFSTSYEVDYNLPKDGEAYTGVALWFPEPQDLSEYTTILPLDNTNRA